VRGRVYTLDKAVQSGTAKDNRLRFVKSVDLTPDAIEHPLGFRCSSRLVSKIQGGETQNQIAALNHEAEPYCHGKRHHHGYYEKKREGFKREKAEYYNST
jgi:hypothetical protein